MKLLTFYLISFKLYVIVLSTDIFTSVSQMKLLLKFDNDFSLFVNKYLYQEEERLQKITKYWQILKNIELKENLTFDTFSSNPIHLFQFIKHSVKNVNIIYNLMNYTTLQESLIKSTNISTFTFPNQEDFKGVAIGLERLRKMYNFNISDLTNGQIVSNVTSIVEMTAYDFWEIGHALAKSRQFFAASLWFYEALLNQDDQKTKIKTKILYSLIISQNKIGNYSGALHWSNELLKIEPNNQKVIEKQKYITSIIKSGRKDFVLDDSVNYAFNPYDRKWPEVVKYYPRLCRNENVQKPDRSLRCYFSKRFPVFILQPLKIEDVHLKPWVAIIHEILGSEEIMKIKTLAIPGLKRAVVAMNKTVSFRISKTSWLDDKIHPLIKRVSQRLEAITGLDFKHGAEKLQVNNYGIGGHYEPHYDFIMNDVKAGGRTVFPRLKLSVKPEKGSAIFWYNLYKTGTGDTLTVHAACPVLYGTKWVCNKWIHVNPQIFKKPCGKSEKDLYFINFDF